MSQMVNPNNPEPSSMEALSPFTMEARMNKLEAQVVELSHKMDTQFQSTQEFLERFKVRMQAEFSSLKHELMEALGLNESPPLVPDEELGNPAGDSVKMNLGVEVIDCVSPHLVPNDMHNNSLPSLEEIDVEITAQSVSVHNVMNCNEIVGVDYVILGEKFPGVNIDYVHVVGMVSTATMGLVVRVDGEPYVLHVDPKMPMYCETYNCVECVGMDYLGGVENSPWMNIDFASLIRILLTSMRWVLQVEVGLDVFYSSPKMPRCSEFNFDPGGIIQELSKPQRTMEDVTKDVGADYSELGKGKNDTGIRCEYEKMNIVQGILVWFQYSPDEGTLLLNDTLMGNARPSLVLEIGKGLWWRFWSKKPKYIVANMFLCGCR
nr:histone acetyltransferase HAC1-like isoform X1 [Ipomoea batatas]